MKKQRKPLLKNDFNAEENKSVKVKKCVFTMKCQSQRINHNNPPYQIELINTFLKTLFTSLKITFYIFLLFFFHSTFYMYSNDSSINFGFVIQNKRKKKDNVNEKRTRERSHIFGKLLMTTLTRRFNLFTQVLLYHRTYRTICSTLLMFHHSTEYSTQKEKKTFSIIMKDEVI